MGEIICKYCGHMNSHMRFHDGLTCEYCQQGLGTYCPKCNDLVCDNCHINEHISEKDASEDKNMTEGIIQKVFSKYKNLNVNYYNKWIELLEQELITEINKSFNATIFLYNSNDIKEILIGDNE